ncbi:hypothetical protein HDV05_002017 [Chytridiales sp. JEL 0842]|nr:hypothetical protein HDV05_002017 [Chytridiales sp. JEL 0842]
MTEAKLSAEFQSTLKSLQIVGQTMDFNGLIRRVDDDGRMLKKSTVKKSQKPLSLVVNDVRPLKLEYPKVKAEALSVPSSQFLSLTNLENYLSKMKLPIPRSSFSFKKTSFPQFFNVK